MCPMKPKKPCKQPGCPLLTNSTYCEQHIKLHLIDRPSAIARGYNSRWRKESKRFLKANPLCVYCLEKGKLTIAEVVDHKVPHRENYNLFWDKGNWQSLCKRCHDKKTMTEERYREYKY